MLRWFVSCIFKLSFKLLGWKTVGGVPPTIHKAVIIAAPHTSNWDFFYGMGIIFIKSIPAKFAIKKEVMFFPLGPILRWMGAIPIDRGHTTMPKRSQVDKLITLLSEAENLFLIIAPEGTRRYVARWKTGFYYIALQTKVPMVLAYLDYAKKEVGIGPLFYPSGNIEEDMQTIKAFYKEKNAKYPQQGVH